MWEKEKRLDTLVESLNRDFVKYSFTAADENDPKKMKEMLVKGHGLNWEADKAEKDTRNWENNWTAQKQTKI